MAAVYQSVPLHLSPTINTRLLKLDLNHPTAMISVELHLISLENPPPYTAVSYVWGQPSPTHQILLNGQPFTVRQNLWDLLNQLWNVEYHGYLWIDVLLIDQTSNSEKTHQVGIMASIYIKAEKTIFWLGIPDEKDVEKFHTLKFESRKPGPLFAQHKQDTDNDPSLHNDGLEYVLTHQYWTHTWIMQEFILSSSVMFWCGNEILPASELVSRAQERFTANRNLDANAKRRASSLILSKSIPHSKSFFNLQVLLILSSESQCVDPRDRIYALLSLLSPQERELWGITPDYAASTQGIFEHLCTVVEDPNLEG